jgi:hypothetical protein
MMAAYFGERITALDVQLYPKTRSHVDYFAEKSVAFDEVAASLPLSVNDSGNDSLAIAASSSSMDTA